MTPDYKNILIFIENLKQKLGSNNQYDIQCGYEAGCLGCSLYNQLTAAGVKCVILASTTMLAQQGTRIKANAGDACMIAQRLSYGGYHAVYIPTEEEAAVKEYFRMRNDHKLALKKIKQQINAFCLRHEYHYEGTKWTFAHLKWLKKLELKGLYWETGLYRENTWCPMESGRQRSSGLTNGSKRSPCRKISGESETFGMLPWDPYAHGVVPGGGDWGF